MIYLIGKERFTGVKNIVLNTIKFMDFSINLNDFDALIITSQNALKALKQSKSELNLAINIYAVGQESANYAKKLGFTQIKIPPKAYGKDLSRAFKDELKDKKCLYLRAKTIASHLDKELINAGVKLSQIITYENIYQAPKRSLKLQKPAVFIFTSPSGVNNFLKTYELNKNDQCVVIGTTTAAALPQMQNIFIPKEQSIKACVALAKTLMI